MSDDITHHTVYGTVVIGRGRFHADGPIDLGVTPHDQPDDRFIKTMPVVDLADFMPWGWAWNGEVHRFADDDVESSAIDTDSRE